jgi:uncharacterized protein YggE
MRSIFILLFVVALQFLLSFKAVADTRTISVSGSAEKSIEPNMMNIRIDVWGKAPTAKKAQQLSSAEYQHVKKVIETFKIKNSDLRTENYDLNPETQYDQKTQTSKTIGFKAAQTLTVTLRNTSEAGNFIDALVTPSESTNAGVSVNDIRWDTDKKNELEMSGLADAVKNARAKADEMAKAAGVKIKGVLHLAHGSQFSAPPVPMRAFAKTMMSNANDSAPATELSPGQAKVRVDVQADFEIAD